MSYSLKIYFGPYLSCSGLKVEEILNSETKIVLHCAKCDLIETTKYCGCCGSLLEKKEITIENKRCVKPAHVENFDKDENFCDITAFINSENDTFIVNSKSTDYLEDFLDHESESIILRDEGFEFDMKDFDLKLKLNMFKTDCKYIIKEFESVYNDIDVCYGLLTYKI